MHSIFIFIYFISEPLVTGRDTFLIKTDPQATEIPRLLVVAMACLKQKQFVMEISMFSDILTVSHQTAGVELKQEPGSLTQLFSLQTDFT